MNILVLTPDGVGSSLLQRVLTVYMASSDFDKNVVNLHELTNGLEKVHSDKFNQWQVVKNFDVGYSQSLPDIVNMLESVDQYSTSRLARYHLLRRKDSIADQHTLYSYLNDNFFIIMAQRENVFEYALNWSFKSFSKTANVYTHEEKIEQIYNLRNRVKIEPEVLINYLDKYVEYTKWAMLNFNINSVFKYENHNNIEEYIHDLPMFHSKKKPTWSDITGSDWNTWNRCHKLTSDGLLVGPKQKLLTADSKLNNVQENAIQIPQLLPVAEKEFLDANFINYTKGQLRIQELIDLHILPSGIPIKMQTLAEKKMLIKNFDELVGVYNNWAQKNDYPTYDTQDINKRAIKELSNWYTPSTVKLLT